MGEDLLSLVVSFQNEQGHHCAEPIKVQRELSLQLFREIVADRFFHGENVSLFLGNRPSSAKCLDVLIQDTGHKVKIGDIVSHNAHISLVVNINKLAASVASSSSNSGPSADGTPPEEAEAGTTMPSLHGELSPTGVAARFKELDQDALNYLDEHGYVVVKSVLSPTEVTKALSLMWDWIESRTAMKRHDPDTWVNDQFPGDPSTGIIWDSAGQSQCAWYCREQCAPAFLRLWGLEKRAQLCTSFDGINIFRPQKRYRTQGGWWHMDQNPATTAHLGRQTVQGFVALTAATEHTGGLCVLEGSSKSFSRWAAKYPGRLNSSFVPIPQSDSWFRRAVRTSARLVTCAAGDLVLWDSRTVHCNHPGLKPAGHCSPDLSTRGPTYAPQESSSSLSHAPPEAMDRKHSTSLSRTESKEGRLALRRAAVYVCMIPKQRISPELARFRIQAVRQGYTLTHNPSSMTKLGRPDQLEDRPPEQRLSEAQRVLI